MASKAFSIGVLCLSILLFMNIYKTKKCHSAFIHKSFKELTKIQYKRKSIASNYGLICDSIWSVKKEKDIYKFKNYKKSKQSLISLKDILKK